MSPRSRGLLSFLLLVFAITWFIEIGLLRGMRYGSVPYQISLVGVMFIPAICALIVRRFIEREGFGDAGLRWGRGRYYLWAWLAPVGLGLVAAALSLLLRQAEFDPYMTELMVRIHRQSPNLKIPPIHLLRLYIILGSLTQSVAMNTIFCFGEEFGWRGYLLMRLTPLGLWPAMIVSGAIWGLWHAPIILQGHNYPDHPQLGVLLMTSFCILLSIIFSWLRLASGSVFTAALAHASINGPAFTALIFMRDRNDITTALTGVIGQAVMVIFTIALWRFGAFQDILYRGHESRAHGSSDIPVATGRDRDKNVPPTDRQGEPEPG